MIYYERQTFVGLEFQTHGANIVMNDVAEFYYPYPRLGPVPIQYRNKAWDPSTGWVYWDTDTPDKAGRDYPGPSSFLDVSNYRVEAVVYGRYQL